MLRIRFLGIPHIDLGLAPLETPPLETPLNGRVLALFAYLCVTRQPHNRSTLANLLWDELSEQEAKINLRYQLRNLRRVVGDYLIVDGQTIAFNQTLPSWSDATIFTTHLSPNITSTSTLIEPEILQELLGLYNGEFLTGFYIQDASNFERWVLAQRRNLHDLMIYGLQRCTAQHLEMGEYEAGLALNQYLLNVEPWREEAHRQRMILLADSGQRSAALMQYKICCQTLEEELDVPPMNETTSLYTQIKSGQWFAGLTDSDNRHSQQVAVRAYPQTSPHLIRSRHASPPHKDAAPIQTATGKQGPPLAQVDFGTMPGVNQFIGRQKELAMLKVWVEDDKSQLVAILGLGGQGKSALAACFVQGQVDQGQVDQGQVGSREVPANGFTQIIWRSLNLRPSCTEILQGWIEQLCNTPRAELSTNFDQLVATLFTTLQQQRCLLVLDGVEAILQGAILQHDSREDQMQAEAYETLFRLFTQRKHRSCLLLTSRTRPTALTHMGKRNTIFHDLELRGLTLQDGTELLAAQGIDGNPIIYKQLHQCYFGNPLLLGQAASLINDLFEGDIEAFLQENIFFMSDIGATLTQQLDQLSSLEQRVLAGAGRAQCCQALNRQTLWKTLSPPPTKQDYYHALQSLQRAFLIQQENSQVKLPDLLAAYLAEHTR